MENDKIIEMLYNELQKQDFWFTTKNDPVFAETPKYIKLDDYGCLTDTSKKQVIKELNSFIGDGASDIIGAIDIWITDALMEGTVASNDVLVTKFKDKPVVDNIEAFESSVQLRTESLKKNSKIVESIYDYGYSVFAQDPRDNVIKSFDKFVVGMGYNHLEDAKKDAELYAEELRSKGYKEVSVNEYGKQPFEPEELEDYITNWEIHFKKQAKRVDWVGQAHDIDLIRINGQLYKFNITTKQLVDNDTYEPLTEGFKGRLQEENTKSQQLITSMLQADDFDSESPQGKIVLKTSDLYNKLSSKGYDVIVSFDNGNSQSSILLGQQGGQVTITITDSNQPLQAFASGNFEVTDDNLTILDDIKEQLVL